MAARSFKREVYNICARSALQLPGRYVHGNVEAAGGRKRSFSPLHSSNHRLGMRGFEDRLAKVSWGRENSAKAWHSVPSKVFIHDRRLPPAGATSACALLRSSGGFTSRPPPAQSPASLESPSSRGEQLRGKKLRRSSYRTGGLGPDNHGCKSNLAEGPNLVKYHPQWRESL
jgi:hypothetical protein